MKVHVEFLQRVETEASKAAWAKATARVEAEYDKLMAQRNLLQRGVVSPQMVEMPKMPGYTEEEAKARDFSQGYKIAELDGIESDAIPQIHEIVTLGVLGTFVVTNREFVYGYDGFEGTTLNTVFIEVWPYDDPLPNDPELRVYGKTPPLSKLEIIPKPEAQ